MSRERFNDSEFRTRVTLLFLREAPFSWKAGPLDRLPRLKVQGNSQRGRRSLSFRTRRLASHHPSRFSKFNRGDIVSVVQEPACFLRCFCEPGRVFTARGVGDILSEEDESSFGMIVRDSFWRIFLAERFFWNIFGIYCSDEVLLENCSNGESSFGTSLEGVKFSWKIVPVGRVLVEHL